MIHFWVCILDIKTQHTINIGADTFLGPYSGNEDTTYISSIRVLINFCVGILEIRTQCIINKGADKFMGGIL